MDKYYYLVVQLPALVFDRASQASEAEFLAEARKWLSPSDWALLEGVDLTGPLPAAGPSTLRRYWAFEAGLRHQIAAWRRARREGRVYRLQGLPADLLEAGTPLEIEERLLKVRWECIDDLTANHYFDLEFVAFYRLKLQILRRLSCFDRQRGVARFEQLCEVKL